MRRKISTIQIQCENPKTIIDEELKKIDANLGDNYDNFIEYCKIVDYLAIIHLTNQ